MTTGNVISGGVVGITDNAYLSYDAEDDSISFNFLGNPEEERGEGSAPYDFMKIVTELPETGVTNKIYFIAKSTSGDSDVYDEYMWVNSKWELLGTKRIEIDLTDYVKNTDYATADKGGVVKVKQYDCGLWMDNGQLKVITSSDNLIKAGINEFRPIVPSNQHRSIFWGLSKLAGVDLKDAQNVEIGIYPEESKKAIQEMLGITDLIGNVEDILKEV